jgi:hypothetical protein
LDKHLGPELVYPPDSQAHQKLEKKETDLLQHNGLTEDGGSRVQIAEQRLASLLEQLEASQLTQSMVLGIAQCVVARSPCQLIGSLPLFLAIRPLTSSRIFNLRPWKKIGSTELALMHSLRRH